jgi:hypothetical protein
VLVDQPLPYIRFPGGVPRHYRRHDDLSVVIKNVLHPGGIPVILQDSANNAHLIDNGSKVRLHLLPDKPGHLKGVFFYPDLVIVSEKIRGEKYHPAKCQRHYYGRDRD